jgi:hypothetical protein
LPTPVPANARGEPFLPIPVPEWGIDPAGSPSPRAAHCKIDCQEELIVITLISLAVGRSDLRGVGSKARGQMHLGWLLEPGAQGLQTHGVDDEFTHSSQQHKTGGGSHQGEKGVGPRGAAPSDKIGSGGGLLGGWVRGSEG